MIINKIFCETLRFLRRFCFLIPFFRKNCYLFPGKLSDISLHEFGIRSRRNRHHLGICRDKHRLTLMNEYFVSFIVADRSLTLHTYIYDKRIEFGEVAHHHRIEVEQVCREILAVGQFDCRVGMCLIMRAVVGRHGIVDGIFGQLGMQFTPVTVGILTIVVVDAVSDVAGSAVSLR